MENNQNNPNNEQSQVMKPRPKKKRPDFINNSGTKEEHIVNIVSKPFNWGAFLLTWIWGCAHKSYITLIIIPAALIPLVGPVISFGLQIWFGFKGNTWAWQNKRYKGIKEFHESQKKWATASIIVTISSIVVIAAMTLPVLLSSY